MNGGCGVLNGWWALSHRTGMMGCRAHKQWCRPQERLNWKTGLWSRRDEHSWRPLCHKTGALFRQMVCEKRIIRSLSGRMQAMNTTSQNWSNVCEVKWIRGGDNWQVVELDIAWSIRRTMIIAEGSGFVGEFRIKMHAKLLRVSVLRQTNMCLIYSNIWENFTVEMWLITEIGSNCSSGHDTTGNCALAERWPSWLGWERRRKCSARSFRRRR